MSVGSEMCIRDRDRRAYDAPQSSEPPPQPQKPFAPLGAPPEPFKPTGDPRRDAKLAYAAALREQMAAPKSSLRRSWGYDALPDDDALRSPPREKAPPRDDVRAPGPLGGAYALRPEQEPRRLSYPQQPSPERLAHLPLQVPGVVLAREPLRRRLLRVA